MARVRNKSVKDSGTLLVSQYLYLIYFCAVVLLFAACGADSLFLAD